MSLLGTRGPGKPGTALRDGAEPDGEGASALGTILSPNSSQSPAFVETHLAAKPGRRMWWFPCLLQSIYGFHDRILPRPCSGCDALCISFLNGQANCQLNTTWAPGSWLQVCGLILF